MELTLLFPTLLLLLSTIAFVQRSWFFTLLVLLCFILWRLV